MKILMLTPYLPYPPASGGQIRTLNLLKHLSKNHDITLVSLYKNAQEKKYASHLEAYCKKIYVCKRAERPWQLKNILKSIFSFQPFLVVRNFSEEAKQVVTRLLDKEQFDVIHAETFYIMPHIPQTEINILLVEQTIEYKVYQHFISHLFFPIRFALSLDIFKLKYWEKFYWKKADIVATVSHADQQVIQKIDPHIDPVIIPNGAGDEMFVEKLYTKQLAKPQLLFMGNFSWLQNVEAAQYLIETVFPYVQQKIPHVELVIAGQNALKKLPSHAAPNIQVINIAADDTETVKKLYQLATLFVAPIFGPGGTRLKILASMAAGLPIVSSKTGIEGLGVKDGKHVLIADSPDEFVKNCVQLLQNNELYDDLRKNAFDHVSKYFSWSAIAKKLEIQYRRIMKNA